MRSGSDSYHIIWSPHAKDELIATQDYLAENWSIKHLKNLSLALSEVIENLQQNPKLYPLATLNIDYPLPIHKVNVQRFNTLYYSIDEDSLQVNILSFFSNRQNPSKIRL